MTLDEYRVQAIERLKACSDAVKVRGLLDEVDLVLVNSRISGRAQKLFWQTLNNDLDIVAQESRLLLEEHAATALSAVITAAQAVIFEYQLVVASDEETPAL